MLQTKTIAVARQKVKGNLACFDFEFYDYLSFFCTGGRDNVEFCFAS
jgi:hypothetical protein